MNRTISFQIPASTSNLGAGFDALSLALQRHLKINLEIGTPDFEIVPRGIDADLIPATTDNLILRVAMRVAMRRKKELPKFRITIDNQIPLARGMGSSAAAIIGGITCYELAADDRLQENDIFSYAREFESHPDNLAAALRGGLVAATESTDGNVLVAKLQVADGATALVVVPEFELSTEKARAVLPQTYSRKDAVYNIQHSGLTIAALTTGNWSLLREAMRDRLHQPYRAALIPGFEEIMDLDEPGLLGVALSGAGPTIFALTRKDDADRVGQAIVNVFNKHGVKATPVSVNIDNEGRTIGPFSN